MWRSAVLILSAVRAAVVALVVRVPGRALVVPATLLLLLGVVTHVPGGRVVIVLRSTCRYAHLRHVSHLSGHALLAHLHLRGHHVRLAIGRHVLRTGGVHLTLVHGLVRHLHMRRRPVARVLRVVGELLLLLLSRLRDRAGTHLHRHLVQGLARRAHEGHLPRREAHCLHVDQSRRSHELAHRVYVELLRGVLCPVAGRKHAALHHHALRGLYEPNIVHVQRNQKRSMRDEERQDLPLSRL